MQAKILSWLVFLGAGALCLTLWRFTGEMWRLACDRLEGHPLPALTVLILSRRWLLLCLPLPWLLAAVITSLRREPTAMPVVISVLFAVGGGACLAFWVVIGMVLPFVDLINSLGA